MAYSPKFKPCNNGAGVFPILGKSPQGIHETSTVQNYPLLTRITAKDPVFGEAEFIYLTGIAATAVGDVVTYTGSGLTIRAAGAAAKGQACVAMSACVAANYGWYCILGRCYVNIASDVAGALTAYAVDATAGVVDDAVVATNQVTGMELAIGLAAGGSDIVGTTELTPANQTVAHLNYPAIILAV